VILKLASTLDGRIATRSGHSRWINGKAAILRAHWLRSRVQAVMVGGNTLYADDPLLTPRLPGRESVPEEEPLAVAVTSRLPAPDSSLRLLRRRPKRTIFFTTGQAAGGEAAKALRALGALVYGLEGKASDLCLEQALEILLQKHNCRYVLCEGGGGLGLALLRLGLADELHLHLSPKILGDSQARPLFAGLAPARMEEALSLRLASFRSCAEDCAELKLTLPEEGSRDYAALGGDPQVVQDLFLRFLPR
jgi:diaminohydroxyphosphoribosylaminopyrimidine deaminase/5-amino-6-(5-phosphoribosylamino)uracil reductase